MKIKSVKAFPVNLRMRIPYRTAFVDRWDSPSAICVIHTDEEVFGVGQATTSSPGYSPYDESLDDIITTIHRLSPKLEGVNPWDVAEIHRIMDQFSYGHRFAHTAVDLTVH
ncbi:MAG: hypothetical protein ABIG67_00505, partial [Pseudomonadota bacterium]